MIEVRKLIPQVYNQSRDFSVFMGLLQALINEVDVETLGLSGVPSENILPPELSTYSNLRGYFRHLVKNKGTVESILQAVSLSGGETICKLEDESDNIGDDYWDYETGLRSGITSNESRYVYYFNLLENTDSGLTKCLELNINLKDPSQVDQSLLNKLLYYIKPVNLMVRLRKGEIKPQ